MARFQLLAACRRNNDRYEERAATIPIIGFVVLVSGGQDPSIGQNHEVLCSGVRELYHIVYGDLCGNIWQTLGV